MELTNVADDGVVAHLLNVASIDNALAASGGHKDVSLLAGLLHGGDLESLHGSLQRVDGVDLRHQHTRAKSTQSLSAALADISVASNDGNLSGNHDISGTLDAIDERLAAAVQVVELALGDTVVHVDCGDLEGADLHHLVQIVHASRGLLRHTLMIR